MIAIIDYGAGNLFSVQNALRFLGVEFELTSDRDRLAAADGLILPGVGAFPDAMKMLASAGLISPIREEAERKPLLGICLGMQVLFETGYEFTETEGLGLIPGTVKPIEAGELKVPHMGWNELVIQNPSPIMADVRKGDYVYFVHSYAASCEDRYINAYCEYGVRIPAVVSCGKVFGTQFHPEKSGEIGLSILKNFERLVEG